MKKMIKLKDKNIKVKNIKVSTIDIDRKERCGIPEIIFGEKDSRDIVKIIKEILKKDNKVIITRIDKAKKAKILNELNKKHINFKFKYNERGRVLIIYKEEKYNTLEKTKSTEKIGLITAGTSDINVAEEAKEVALQLGCGVVEKYDVGIAGLHRTIKAVEGMKKNNIKCIIVIAGMEGALPSVISGLTNIPVIAVPTSVGYGTGKKGLAAIMTMLNSCTSVAVMNIDNGFGAAVMAYKIIRVGKKDIQATD